jgi:hypothetical protein
MSNEPLVLARMPGRNYLLRGLAGASIFEVKLHHVVRKDYHEPPTVYQRSFKRQSCHSDILNKEIDHCIFWTLAPAGCSCY